ncbi:hypothetical protein K466DRAFT_495422 [Polyporus arcularius HHB13444]|uniref:JmjC domain-containing protein n=1 Tax=Polyporus arcularius HHB13444 TaxID=1314778 RepID=A0A5C3P816_9APHY|nr:hypothetical protein K466DRAFT_495422 [Polyporus arcularius HHB13444]
MLLSDGTFTSSEFHSLWRHGAPIVISGVDKRLQGRWTPADFIADYGHHKISVLECTNDGQKTRRSTMAEFFSTLSTPDADGPYHKLKDWPTQRHFKSAYEQLYIGFCSSVPCPDLVCPNGILNLAGHSPTNSVAPDLGPKLYAAPAAKPGTATTNLHMDITDAANLMVWCAAPTGAIGAFWDIFAVHSADVVRQFIREECDLEENIDPIHSQSYYLNEEQISRLTTGRNVQHWRVEQRVGDVIFIPAGCAHQVVNIANAVKVAIDFVSAENLHVTGQLVPGLRAQRLSSQTDDVLQLRNTLWYAWCSFSSYDKPVQDEGDDHQECE